MARLTVKQLAGLSGVSVRTLHYYDEIGLLTPTDIGANGYRYYDRPELLRLQQILFYRELGMPLVDIAKTIDDPAFDRREALQRHRQHLESDIKRYRRLIRTIDETLHELNGEKMMENPYVGFSPEKQKAHEDALISQHGDHVREHITQSRKRAAAMSEVEQAAVKEEGHQINLDLMVRIDAGDEAQASLVQVLVQRHYDWVCNYWTPNRDAYCGLAQTYMDNPEFRAFYDKYDPRLTDFLAAAMKVYAEANLD